MAAFSTARAAAKTATRTAEVAQHLAGSSNQIALDAMGRVGDWLTETPLLDSLTATADSPIAALTDASAIEARPHELDAVNTAPNARGAVDRDAISGSLGTRTGESSAAAVAAQVKDGVVSAGLETSGPGGGGWIAHSSDGVWSFGNRSERDGRTIRAGGSIDLDEQGRAEGAAAGATLEKGGASIGASAGIVARSSEPEPRADGSWVVRWEGAVGAAAHATGSGEQQTTVGGSTGLSRGAVGERTFATREEADAFRAGLLPTELLRASYTAAEVAALPPGGIIRHDVTTQVDTSGELGVVGVGLSKDATHQIRIERLDGAVVRVTAGHEQATRADGSVGTGPLGAEASRGYGTAARQTADFDLSQPGALEAFEVFQRTGELPEKLPGGVVAGAREHERFTLERKAANLPNGGSSVDIRRAQGESIVDGVATPYVEVQRAELERRGMFFRSDNDRTATTHTVRVQGAEGEETVRLHSAYSGHGACGLAANDLGDAGREAHAEALAACDDHIEFERVVETDQLNRLAGQILESGASDGVTKEHVEQIQEYGWWGELARLRRALLGEDVFAIADYVKDTGGHGMRFLRNQAAGEAEPAAKSGVR